MSDEGLQVGIVGVRSRFGSAPDEQREVGDVDCTRPPAYLIAYDFGGEGGSGPEWATCAEHTAELRANDPLGYIASVRTLRAGDGRG